MSTTINAQPYLGYGDFHIFIDNGNPKLGVRFEESMIHEIIGEDNNGKIPVEYLDEIKKTYTIK